MFYKKKKNEEIVELPNFFVSFTDLVLLIVVFLLIFFSLKEKDFDELLNGNENFNVRENIAKILAENFKEFDNVKVDSSTGIVTILNNEIEFVPRQDVFLNKVKSESFLDKFVPIYIASLKENKDNYKYVSNIIIEGHTAKPDDRDLDQMYLSLHRAFTVYRYVYNNKSRFNIDNNDLKKIEATGKGSQNLYNTSNPVDGSNRRVEFHFILDEAKLIKDYNDSLKNGKRNG